MRLPLDRVYLFCKNASPKYVQTFCQKYVTNVANMLKIISLTGTPHNLVRRFLECYRDIYFFVNKDKENISNKQNCFVVNPARDLIFMSNFSLFFNFIFNYWIQHYNFFVSKRETYPEPYSEPCQASISLTRFWYASHIRKPALSWKK